MPESALAATKLTVKPKIALGPGGSFSVSDAKPMDIFMPRGVLDRAHVIGRAEYKDAFNVPRTTNFKMRYVVGNTGVEGWEPTEDGNDAT